MDRILYLHGFATTFDPTSPKVQALAQLGTVHGIDLRYDQPPEDTLARVAAEAAASKATLIAGTSMGGWAATWVGTRLGLPYLALNPAVDPASTLARYRDQPVRYRKDMPYSMLREAVLLAYEPLAVRPEHVGVGLVLSAWDDDTIPTPSVLAAFADSKATVRTLASGGHRLHNLVDALPAIRRWWQGLAADEDASAPP